jgi:hypothetical protein
MSRITSGSLSLSVGGGSDWTRFSVFSITVDMAFNHDRTANDGSDGINIRTNGTANTKHYGAELIQNTSATWTTPNGAAGNKTVLYLANKSVTIYNRFVMSLVIPYTVTLNLKATAVPATVTTADGTIVTMTNTAIGGCEETTATFTNGVSTGGKSVSGVDGFIEFAASSNTSDKINKEQSKFDWYVTKIIGKTDGIGQALETDMVTFYTILNTPQTPWNVNDTTISDLSDPSKTIPQDDKIQPWVAALEFTIGTAAVKGNSSPELALSRLTTFLHAQDDSATTDVIEGHGLTYDTTSGEAKYYEPKFDDPLNPTVFYGYSFDTAAYITKGKGNTANCYDQAAALTVFGRLFGMNVQYAFSNPFGYIETTELVGNIITNNPFAGSPFDTSGFSINGFPFIEHTDTTGNITEIRTSFGNHAFVVLNNLVYDACAGPITGITVINYFEKVIDFQANIEHNLKYGNTYKENATDMTYEFRSIIFLE